MSDTSRPNITYVPKYKPSDCKNPKLLDAVQTAASKLNYVVKINSIDGGGHEKDSRHYRGLAVDIASIIFDGDKGYTAVNRGIGNSAENLEVRRKCEAFVQELEKLGYARNIEEGNPRAVLYWRGPNDHENHIHVSNTGDGANTGGSASRSDHTFSPTQENTGLKYFHFDHEYMEKGVALFREYQSEKDSERMLEDKPTNLIGFIPMELNITLDGMSGWKIYNKLIIDQEILPPEYPKEFHFIITGLSHNVRENDWTTDISALSQLDVKTYKWDYHEPNFAPTPTNSDAGLDVNVSVSKSQKEWMLILYDILTKEKKWSHSQACCFIAEVGRENSFNEADMFGTHIDAANSKRNIGIISFQKDRYPKLLAYLRPKGFVINDQQLQRSRACVSAQFDYIIHEINTDPDYDETKTKFLGNPNVTYDVAKKVLGKNYIRWAYGDGKFGTGHYNRNVFYAKIQELTKSLPKTSESTKSTSGASGSW